MNFEEKALKTRKEYKQKIKDIDKKLNKRLLEDYRTYIKLIDIMVIIMVFMNFGALTLTNMLVVREVPQENRTFVELNPIAEEVHGFQGVSEEQKAYAYAVIFSYILQVLIWTILIFLYLLMRKNITRPSQIWIVVFYMVFLFLALGLDFFNNLGLWVGSLM